MHKRSETFIQKHRPALMIQAIETGKACEDLQVWLKTAGPRKAWSAHMKLAYEANFAAASQAVDSLGATLVSLLPSHWDMSDYAMRLTRDGKSMRLAAKGGKAQGGLKMGTTVGDAISLAGQIVGLVTASKENNPQDTNRLKSLYRNGLSSTFTFWLNEHNQLQAEGLTPRDAAARAKAQGEMTQFFDWTTLDTPEQVFEYSCSRMRSSLLAKLPRWSVMPSLWNTLAQNKTVNRLYRESLQLQAWKTPWAKMLPKEVEALETLFAAAIRLLPLITTGSKTDWLVVTSSANAETVQAWCPASALVWSFLNDVKTDIIPYSFAEWQVYPTTAEKGLAARAAMGIQTLDRPKKAHDHGKEKRLAAWARYSDFDTPY